MKKSVLYTSWKFRLCTGCGLCELVCPVEAVQVGENKYGDPRPFVDPAKCTDCGLCGEYCPFNHNGLKKLIDTFHSSGDPNSLGLEQADFYLAFDKSTNRKESASGGVVSRWLVSQLNSGAADAIIHGQPLNALRGESHFSAACSKTAAEVNARRSTFYAPLNFSRVVRDNCKNRKIKLIMVGTPCVVRGYKKLFSCHPDFKNNSVRFVCLVCSHNVSGGFCDFMADSLGVSRNISYKMNFRSKRNIPDAAHFKIVACNERGEEIAKADRLEGDYTRFWRNYSFALNPCHYCPDFWGQDAEMSVKDAWGTWAVDPGGTGIVIVRDKKWQQDFSEIKNSIYMEKLSFETVAKCQKPTSLYKQAGAYERWKKPVFFPENIRSGFLKYRAIAGFSKRAYRFLGFKACKKMTGRLEDLINFFSGPVKRIFRGAKKILKVLLFPFYPLLWISRFKNFRHCSQQPVILVAGGYGYMNAGDEAQLGTSYKRLRELFPGYLIKVLTPDQEMTFRLHGCCVGEAPRLAFFDADKSNLYALKSRRQKIKFLVRGSWIYFNAVLMRCGLNTFKLDSRRSALLNEIRSSSMIFFCGGGYLTGKTLSRLWDGALLCRLGYLFKIPVALSGQTMGVWGSRLNRIISRWGFSRAQLISLRDPKSSPASLNEISIGGKGVMVTHDDALFCKSENNESLVKEWLEKAGMRENDYDQGYLVFQFHYWGVGGNAAKNSLLEKVYSMIDWTFRTFKLKIVLLGMTPSDEIPLGDFFRRYCHSGVVKFPAVYDYSVIRGVIGRAKACVSMKHHPLVFALGEGVPAFSLSLSEYYAHKNRGALMLCGMEKFNVNLESGGYLTEFREKMNAMLEERESLSLRIIESHKELKLNRRKFDLLLQTLMKKAGSNQV